MGRGKPFFQALFRIFRNTESDKLFNRDGNMKSSFFKKFPFFWFPNCFGCHIVSLISWISILLIFYRTLPENLSSFCSFRPTCFNNKNITEFPGLRMPHQSPSSYANMWRCVFGTFLSPIEKTCHQNFPYFNTCGLT